MSSALDLASKVLAVLTAVLALAGYVLVLGAVIVWLRLHQVDLPPEVPVSIAGHEELIVIGAKAIAVWLALALVFGGLAAWIVTGNPGRRQFGPEEAVFALTMTLATLLPLATDRGWLLFLPITAGALAVFGALIAWPSLEAVGAALLPAAAGVALAIVLSSLDNGNDAATAIGATSIFVALMVVSPSLQEWRLTQERTQTAKARLDREGVADKPTSAALIAALEKTSGETRPALVTWIGRAAIVVIVLVWIGAVAVASQIDRNADFHRALVSLANGDCLEGTFLTRGGEQVVIAEPDTSGNDNHARIATIPDAEISDLQIYGGSLEGVDLARDAGCEAHADRLVEPKKTSE